MKKEIEFDFTKWGQDGISVDDTMGRLVIKLHENPIKDEFYGITHDGSTFAMHKNKFIMFQEVKPREFWVNIHKHGTPVFYYTEETAKSFATDNVTTIKVREVLD